MSTPVVLIHGLLGTLQDAEIMGQLEPGSALAPDLAGYGQLRGATRETITVAGQFALLNQVITERFGEQGVYLVGHSIGGAIACLFAHRYPERVLGIVSVEGNFTLKDAFWSAAVAKMSAAEAEQMLEQFRGDPAAWLARSGIPAEPHLMALAKRWLMQQPASTMQAMAQSVVETTGAPEYLLALREVFARHPVHLVAGARSRAGWDVPPWALENAASFTVLPNTGHLMMLEQPRVFGELLASLLRHQSPALSAG